MSRKTIKWISPYQKAKLEGVSVQTIYQRIRERKILPENVRRVKKVVERIEVKE
jgi:hypothetical protein